MNITIIGLGYIGFPVAIKLAEAGFHIHGYDIDSQRIQDIETGNFNIQEPELYERYHAVKSNLSISNKLVKSSTYIVTVQTPVDQNSKADVSYVNRALQDIGKFLSKGDLVILESTVPPYSNKAFHGYLSEISQMNINDFDYAYCPETIQPGNVFYELSTNARVIGSINERAFKRAELIYSKLTSGKITHTNFITAEHVKIMQNAYRDYEIAFANALSIYCDEHRMNVFELIGLINQHPRAKVLNPGVGVGGHCLPVDPLFIIEKSSFEPITFSRNMNNHKTDYVVEKIMNQEPKKVILFGATYKPNSDDLRHSPSIEIANQLIRNHVEVFFCEPNINQEFIYGIKNIKFDEAIKIKSLKVITQKHDVFIKGYDNFGKIDFIDFVGLDS